MINFIYLFSSRNGDFVGFTSSTAYGFTLQKMVALGFVRHPDSIAGNLTPVDTKWLLDDDAKWAIDVNGEMIPVRAHLNPPNLPIIQQESLSAFCKCHNKRVLIKEFDLRFKGNMRL